METFHQNTITDRIKFTADIIEHIFYLRHFHHSNEIVKSENTLQHLATQIPFLQGMQNHTKQRNNDEHADYYYSLMKKKKLERTKLLQSYNYFRKIGIFQHLRNIAGK